MLELEKAGISIVLDTIREAAGLIIGSLNYLGAIKS